VWSAGWGFRIYVDEANYILFPLGALAVDNDATGRCDIYVQYLNPQQVCPV